MKVLKFGGTSVGTIDSLRNVKKIVESLEEPAIVVVSALGGLTDKLIATANGSVSGTFPYKREMEEIRLRHYNIINELVPESRRKEVLAIIDPLLNKLEGLFQGVSLINELSERTLDRIVSFGERMSSVIVSAIINNASHVDSLECIKTERWMGRNIADRVLIDRLVKQTFQLPIDKHFVVGGFISKDRDTGIITNLGRGGSDYTAALIAAALDAEILEIWTDVDGFMTADPRIIPNAKIIDKMSFVESMELCSFGAKVIYPPTIYPVFHKNIPIKIRNTHNPDAQGTLITDNVEDMSEEVRGVSVVRHTAMVTVSGRLASNIAELNSRAFNAMTRAGVSVLLISQLADEMAFSISLLSGDGLKAVDVLKDEFAPELGVGELGSITLKEDMAIIAVVRDGIKKINGLGGRIVNTLQRDGISVWGLSDGASETTVAVVVEDDNATKALALAHAAVIG